MRRSTLVAGICIAGLTSIALPSAAHSTPLGAPFNASLDARLTAASAMPSDMSAAKKKKRTYVYRRVAEPMPAARRGWSDPSLGPDGRPYRNPYPPGTCSTDLGYGRFGNCDADHN